MTRTISVPFQPWSKRLPWPISTSFESEVGASYLDLLVFTTSTGISGRIQSPAVSKAPFRIRISSEAVSIDEFIPRSSVSATFDGISADAGCATAVVGLLPWIKKESHVTRSFPKNVLYLGDYGP